MKYLLCYFIFALLSSFSLLGQVVVNVPTIYPADSIAEIDVAPYLPEQIAYTVSFSNPSRGTVSLLSPLKVRYVANSITAAAYGDSFTCDFNNGFSTISIIVIIDKNIFSTAPPLISNNNTFTYCTDQIGVGSIEFATSDVGNNYWRLENQIITQPMHGTATVLPPTEDGNNETFLYTPLPGFVGTDTIHYRVCELDSSPPLCSEGILLIESEDCMPNTIQAYGVDVVIWGTPDSVVTHPLHYCYADSLPVSIELLGDGFWGNAVLNADQSVSYFPSTYGYELYDAIPYRICDPSNNCSVANLMFYSMAFYDDPYYPQPEFLNIIKNLPINIDLFANDLGYHEGVVIDSILIPFQYGTLTLETDGTYTYVTNPDIFIPNGATDQMEYYIRTQGGLISYSACNFSIYYPELNNDSYTIPYQTTDTLMVLENDYGSDTHITAIPLQAYWGTVSITDDQQAIIYTPNEGSYGNDLFTYTACDLGNNCDTAFVNIQIAPPDTISSSSMLQIIDWLSICIEDSCSSYNILTRYPSIAPFQYSTTITQPSIYGTSTIDSLGKLCYYINTDMLTADFPLYDTLKVQVCPPNSPDTICGNFIAIIQVNDCYPIMLSPQPYHINLNNDAPLDIAFQLNTTTEYWSNLTYALLDTSTLGTLILNPDGSGHFLSNPNLLPNSADTIVYQCCNNFGICNTNEIYINTSSYYSCCYLSIDDYYTVSAGTTNVLPVLENDNFGMHIIGIIEPPQYGSISYNNSTIFYTPNSNAYHHNGGFGYIAQHTSGLVDTAYVSLYVDVYPLDPAVNYIPSGVNQFFSPCNETNVTFMVISNDPNPNTILALNITQYPQHGTATELNNNAITYNAANNYEGLDTIRYTMCETNTPEHYCRDMYAVFNISDCYAPIEAVPDGEYISLIDNESTTINVLANDYRETNFVTVSIVSSPILGTAILNPNNTISYILNNYQVDSIDINNADHFAYSVCTQAGFCDTAIVSIHFFENELTSLVVDSRITIQDVPVTIDVLANDELNTHLIDFISPPEHGTIVINEDNTFTYTPNENYTGQDYFVYFGVSPYKTPSSTGVFIDVIPAQYNNIPNIVANDDYIEHNSFSISFNVLANDIIVPNDIYSDAWLYLIDVPTGLPIYLSNDGTLMYSYSPDVNFGVAKYVVCSYVGDLLIPNPTVMCDTATIYIYPPFNNGIMYPGDLNNDQIVNTLDLLAFGMAPATTGSPRPNASTVWVGQEGTAWDGYFGYRPFGETLLLNQSLADCNGDGTITPTDASLIQTHYGKSHVEDNNPFEVPVPMFPSNDAPLIRLDLPMTVDTVGHYFADIYLATPDQPAEDMYGVGFALQFPAEQIPLDSMRFYIADSWLGNGNDMVSITHLDDGEAHIALSRRDGQGRAGYGKIGSLSFYVNSTDTLAPPNQSLNFSIDETYYSINTGIVDLLRHETTSQLLIAIGVEPSPATPAPIATQLRVYPNPTRELLNIVVAPDQQIQNILFTDMMGRRLFSPALPDSVGHRAAVSVQHLPEGLYLVEVQTNVGVGVQRVMVR